MRGLCACLLLAACSAEIEAASPTESGELVDASKFERTEPPVPDAGSEDATSTRAKDAAPPEAGDELAPEPAPDPGCASQDKAILCEDFESGSVAKAIWQTQLSNGAQLGVASQNALEGAHALRISLPKASGTGAVMRTTHGFPVSGNRFYGRAYYYISPGAPSTHSYLLAARGKLDGTTAQYRLDSNSGKLNSRYTHASITEHGGLKKLGYPMPKESWLCIEWLYDGAKNEMRYWMDGVAAEQLTVTGNEDPPWVAPVFTDFSVGFHSYQEPEYPVEVWVDAIVLSEERVGCGN